MDLVELIKVILQEVLKNEGISVVAQEVQLGVLIKC